MKKKLAVLLSIMLCLLCLPSAAFATEADEMVPVVVKTPDGWEAPCLWAWAAGIIPMCPVSCRT